MVRLFVGNINHQSNEEGLARWFEGKGYTVVPGRTQIVRDRVTGHSRGFGFVEVEEEPNFNGEDEAEGLHGQKVEGRVLTIRRAHPRKPREAMGPLDHTPRHDRYNQ